MELHDIFLLILQIVVGEIDESDMSEKLIWQIYKNELP